MKAFASRTFQRNPLVAAGITALVLVLALNAFISYRATRRLISANDWVEHTRNIELQIQTIRSLALSAESAQRGFLLTGREEYLEPYATATAGLAPHVKALSTLVADSPAQNARATQLQTLINQKLAELQETIKLQKTGRYVDAIKLVESDLGLHEMDQVRGILDSMSQREAEVLKEREAIAHQSAVMAFSAFGVTTFVAVVGLLLFGRGLQREMRAKAVAAAAIREREEWLSTTIRSIGDAVIATDEHGVIKFLNPVAAQLIGEEAVVGRRISEVLRLVNESTRQPVENPIARVLESGRIVGLANHTVLCRADGAELPIDDSAAPIRDIEGTLIGVVMVFRDVTEQRKMDIALRTTEKLAAAGRLAATVAHEINNPLEAVTNLLYLLRNDPSISEGGKQLLEMSDEQLRRVAHTTKQTLAFYKDTRKPEPILLCSAVERVLDIYKSKIAAKNITVGVDCSDHLAVFASSGEIVQVVSNLVANAIDAVPNQGRVSISAQPDGNGKVVFAIEDSGNGVDPAFAGKIFEPFFTTKKDVGTGLGLWISRNIIENLGGRIDLVSNGAGGGTRFEVRLPRHESASGRATVN